MEEHQRQKPTGIGRCRGHYTLPIGTQMHARHFYISKDLSQDASTVNGWNKLSNRLLHEKVAQRAQLHVLSQTKKTENALDKAVEHILSTICLVHREQLIGCG